MAEVDKIVNFDEKLDILFRDVKSLKYYGAPTPQYLNLKKGIKDLVVAELESERALIEKRMM